MPGISRAALIELISKIIDDPSEDAGDARLLAAAKSASLKTLVSRDVCLENRGRLALTMNQIFQWFVVLRPEAQGKTEHSNPGVTRLRQIFWDEDDRRAVGSVQRRQAAVFRPAGFLRVTLAKQFAWRARLYPNEAEVIDRMLDVATQLDHANDPRTLSPQQCQRTIGRSAIRSTVTTIDAAMARAVALIQVTMLRDQVTSIRGRIGAEKSDQEASTFRILESAMYDLLKFYVPGLGAAFEAPRAKRARDGEMEDHNVRLEKRRKSSALGSFTAEKS